MNPIEQLANRLNRKLPDAKLHLEPPLRKDGVWSLDIDQGEKKLAIEWDPEVGFGISSVTPGNFGERPDESFKSLEQIERRILKLLTSDERTVPPFGVLLSRLREDQGLTQQQLADRLGIQQATISGIEGRKDIQMSTLARTVEALGGILEIYVAYSAARYRIYSGLLRESTHSSMAVGSSAISTKMATMTNDDQRQLFPCLQRSGELSKATMVANDIYGRGSVFEFP